MILTCPSCATRYFADDAAIGPAGRSVRCAACGHSWFAQADLVLSATAPDDLLPDPPNAQSRAPLTREQVERMRRGLKQDAPQTAAARIRAQQATRERKARMRAAAVAWGGAGALVAASVGGAIILREDVARMWPKTASAFAAVGLPVNIYGLEFSDLDIEKGYEGPTPMLFIEGAIRNIGPELKPAPALRFSLRDERGAEIFAWVQRMDGQRIEPGAALPFEAFLPNPPDQAVDLEATFASAAEAAAAPAPDETAAGQTERGDAPGAPGLPEEPAAEPQSHGEALIHGDAPASPASYGFSPRDELPRRLLAAQFGLTPLE